MPSATAVRKIDSSEARRGVTTGISAKDRATTILTAVATDAKPEDLITPGHVFPLRAKRGGVLVRTGQTEGSVDLARLAGLQPAGVICEIMNDDGTMARMPDLEASVYFGVTAPAGTPPEMIRRWNAAINAVLKVDTVRERLISMGYIVTGGTAEAYGQRLAAETARWREVIKKAKIPPPQ